MRVRVRVRLSVRVRGRFGPVEEPAVRAAV